MLILRKSQVKGYERHTQSGAAIHVNQYERRFTPGQKVYFKGPHHPRAMRGTVIEHDGKVKIEGLRQGYKLKPETHELDPEHVWTPEEHEARKRKRSGVHEATSSSKRTISVEESNRRAAAGAGRLGVPETQILTHPKFMDMLGKTSQRLARSNDISPDYKVRGGFIQGEDPEFNDIVSEYTMAAMNSLRHQAANAPEGDLAEFREFLNGDRPDSKVFVTITTAGRGAATRFVVDRSRKKRELTDFDEAMEDPNQRQQLQGMHVAEDYGQDTTATRDQHLERFISKLPPLDADIVRRKFGMGQYDMPQTNPEIAEAIEEDLKAAGHWTGAVRAKDVVGKLFLEAMGKLRNVEGVGKLKDFLKSLREHIEELRKSQETPRPFTICIDFDGPIANYDDGFQGVDIFGDPVPGVAEATRRMKAKGCKVIIFTTRPDTPALRTYLKYNGIQYDEINTNSDQPEGANPGKPIADCYIDDRAVRFKTWAQTLADQALKPIVKSISFSEREGRQCITIIGDLTKSQKDTLRANGHLVERPGVLIWLGDPLIKSHIKTYTRQDGTMVQEHDDKRTRKHIDIAKHEADTGESVHPGSHNPGLAEHLKSKGWRAREVSAVKKTDREPGKKEEMPEPPTIPGQNQENVALKSAQRTIQKMHEAATESDDPASALQAFYTSRGNPYLKAVDDYRTALLKHFGHDVDPEQRHTKYEKDGHTVVMDGDKVAFAGGEEKEKVKVASVMGRTQRETVHEERKGDPTFKYGEENDAYTGKMNKIKSKFALVDVKDLTMSHGVDGQVNTAYPQEIQPRDRARIASRMQIQNIANDIKPELLGMSHHTSDGAPIVGPDGVVESGNGRSIALRLAYQTGRADEYKEWLKGYAKKVDIDPAEVDKMEQPMLVRVRQTEVDRAEFAKEANQSNLMGSSPVEQAFSDAERIDDAMLAKYKPDEDGEIYTEENLPFIADFFSKLGANEAASLRDTDGDPNKKAIERIQAAVFAKVYKSEVLTEMMTESAKPDVRNIVKALNMAAGSYAQIKDPGDLDMIPDALEAIDIYRYCKKNNYEIENVLDQGNLYATHEAPAFQTAYAKDFALIIAQNVKSSKKLGQFFSRLAMEAGEELQARDDTQGDMFGGSRQNRSKHDLITRAKTKMGVTNGQETSGGFDFSKALQDAADSQGSRTETAQGRYERSVACLEKAHIVAYDRMTSSGHLSHVLAHEDRRVSGYAAKLAGVRNHADLHKLRMARFGHLPMWGSLDDDTKDRILQAEDHIHRNLTAADHKDTDDRPKHDILQGDQSGLKQTRLFKSLLLLRRRK